MHISSIELVSKGDYATRANLPCMGAGVGKVLGSGLVDQLSKAGLMETILCELIFINIGVQSAELASGEVM